MYRVLVTRATGQSSLLADALRLYGCVPVLIPTIELAPPASYDALDVALANLEDFHWLLFTSANAVEAFAQRCRYVRNNLVTLSEAPPYSADAQSKDLPLRMRSGLTGPFGTKLAAIGPATAKSLEAIGFTADLIPPQAVAESLATALLPYVLQRDGGPTRFLLVRAEAGRDHLPDTLRDAGAELTIVPAYRTITPESSIAALRQLFQDPAHYPDAITFTSSSTATNLFALLKTSGFTLPPEIVRASIGPITSQTLRDAGLPPHLEASEATIASLAQTLASYLQQR